MFDSIKRLFTKGPPPPPGTSTIIQVPGQRIVEQFFSADNARRVTILQDDRGIFRVCRFRWCVEDWEVAGRAFWIEAGTMNTLTDTLSNARKLAEEYLVGLK